MRLRGMLRSGLHKRIVVTGPHIKDEPQLSFSIVKEVNESDGELSHVVKEEYGSDGESDNIVKKEFQSDVKKEYQSDEWNGQVVTSWPLMTKKKRKRKFCVSGQIQRVEVGREKKRRPVNVNKNSEGVEGRWSLRRYEQGLKSMLEVMKAQGAVFGNPILRPDLRIAARKYVRDTGLLDHLLKHMDGKVAPGASERFRRWHNTSGIMEYWLERADLKDIRKEAGVKDPFWIPSLEWKPGGSASHNIDFAGELKLLKEEMAKMKRDIHELVSKKQDENGTPNSSASGTCLRPLQEMHNELVKWKAKTEGQLMEISGSLSSIQDMYKELEKWKAEIEQKILEISNSLSSMQKQHNTLNPPVSESWKDWLGSTDLVTNQQHGFTPWLESDLVDIQQDDLAQWLESSDLINMEPDVTMQEPCWLSEPEQKPSDGSSQVCSGEQKPGNIPFEELICCTKQKVGDISSKEPICSREQKPGGDSSPKEPICSRDEQPGDVSFQEPICSGDRKPGGDSSSQEPGCFRGQKTGDSSCQELVCYREQTPADSSFQEPVCSRDLKVLKEDMAKMKRDVQELVFKKQDDEANSSTDSNSKMDLDNSILLLQEMHREMVNWKSKIDQQLMEVSKSLNGMQASKECLLQATF